MNKYRVLYLNETEGMILDRVINAEDNLEAIRKVLSYCTEGMGNESSHIFKDNTLIVERSGTDKDIVYSHFRAYEIKDEIDELFGKVCEDKITGFKGICIGKVSWMFGCDQYALVEKYSKEGNGELKQHFFDKGRIRIIEDAVNEIDPEDVTAGDPGGILPPEVYPII